MSEKKIDDDGLSDMMRVYRLERDFFLTGSRNAKAIKLVEGGNVQAAYEEILRLEKEKNGKMGDEKGGYKINKSPSVLLDGMFNWFEYAKNLASRQRQPIRILDLGTGPEARMWTAPIETKGLDSMTIGYRSTKIPTILVTTSLGVLPAKGTDTHITRKHLTGHFVDICDYLLGIGERFDLILSRSAIYQTKLAILLLEKINELLSSNGAAFLETVRRDRSDGVLVIDSSDCWKYGSFQTIGGQDLLNGLTYKEARLFGLPWEGRQDGLVGMDHVSFRKNQFDNRFAPKLLSIGLFEHGAVDFEPSPYLIYCVPHVDKD